MIKPSDHKTAAAGGSTFKKFRCRRRRLFDQSRLGRHATYEISVLITWCTALYPQFLMSDTNPNLLEIVKALATDRDLPREQKHDKGFQLLDRARLIQQGGMH